MDFYTTQYFAVSFFVSFFILFYFFKFSFTFFFGGGGRRFSRLSLPFCYVFLTNIIFANVMKGNTLLKKNTNIIPVILIDRQRNRKRNKHRHMKQKHRKLKPKSNRLFTIAFKFPTPTYPRFPGSWNLVCPSSKEIPLISWEETFARDTVRFSLATTIFSDGTSRAKSP